MRTKRFIYENGADAFSYLVIFVVTVVFPAIISFIVDSIPSLLLTMFINSIGLIREYVFLVKYKNVSKRFWIERLIGTLTSIVIAVYSIGALSFILLDIWVKPISVLNGIFASLFLSPGIIAAIEGILYLKKSYNDEVVRDVVLAEDTAVDV